MNSSLVQEVVLRCKGSMIFFFATGCTSVDERRTLGVFANEILDEWVMKVSQPCARPMWQAVGMLWAVGEASMPRTAC